MLTIELIAAIIIVMVAIIAIIAIIVIVGIVNIRKMVIVLNYCQYGSLYLGSHYNTGPYIDFPPFGNSNLGKLPDIKDNDRNDSFEAVSSHVAPLARCSTTQR